MELFWILCLIQVPFIIQLIAGEIMFSLKYKRRRHFALRCALSLVGELLLCLLVFMMVSQNSSWLVSNLLFYPLLFLITLIGLFVCYDESVWSIVLCGVAGYTAQHLTAQICLILWGNDKITVIFGRSGIVDMVLFRITELLIFAAAYTVIYLVFARKANAVAPAGMLGRNVFLLSVTTLVLMILLSSVRDHYAGESVALTIITRLFSIFCCVFLLLLRSGSLEKSRLEQEMDTISQLRSKERAQYEQSRENIELINIKCHDLKRQIEVYERRGDALTTTELDEIKNAIAIYDTSVKTGNDTLDTVLTERSLYCERHGIKLSCIVDGAKLSFMTVGDICSLFGNAIENAIEAVSQLQRPEDRMISFIVREQWGMLAITIDNYYAGKLHFEDGLPATTKQDTRYHGYGLKSIRLLVEKYGGEMTVSADEMFHLAILLPLPA